MNKSSGWASFEKYFKKIMEYERDCARGYYCELEDYLEENKS